MKLLLLSTSFEDESKLNLVNQNSHYPVGVAYLHSYLESYNHQVESLFLNDHPFDDCFCIIRKKMETYSPDVVGFSIITNSRTSSFRTIEWIHTLYPNTHIIIGGIHTSITYEQIITKYPYVIAVIGEGEATTQKLLGRLEKGEDIDSVNGIAYSKDGVVKLTKPRDLITNLDALPFPNHKPFLSNGRTTATILTSRGCPFRCSFCVLHYITQRKVRFRSIENVIQEIEHLVATYPKVNTVWIHDDVFCINNQRAIEFCDEIVRRKIKLKFICCGRIKPMSKELVSAMERAGFIQILFGLESGSPKVLKAAHKEITQEDTVNTIKLFRDSKIIASVFLIVGLYGEDDDSIDETIRFVKKLQRINYVFFHGIGILMVYPGTEIYEIAKQAGQIDDDYWMTSNRTPLFTVDHSVEKLHYYTDKILDNIALKRMFTFRGFVLQVTMLPAVVRFIVKHVAHIPFVIMHIIRRLLTKGG